MVHTVSRYLLRQDRRLLHATPVYYGWIVVLAATIGMAMTIPGQTVGLSLFIDSFITDLGLTRAGISVAYTLATIAAALILPLVGRWIDRYGPRRAVVVVAVLFGLSCF